MFFTPPYRPGLLSQNKSTYNNHFKTVLIHCHFKIYVKKGGLMVFDFTVYAVALFSTCSDMSYRVRQSRLVAMIYMFPEAIRFKF